MLNKYFFTFGGNTNLRNNFKEVEAEDYLQARTMFVETNGGPNFAFQYSEEGFEGQAEQYDLTLVPFDAVVEKY